MSDSPESTRDISAERTVPAPDSLPSTGGPVGAMLLRAFALGGALPLLLLLLIAAFAYGNPVFLSSGNIRSILVQSVFLGLVALSQMIILITGGFDLSVGSNVALTSIACAMVMQAVYGGEADFAGLALFWGFMVAIGVGLVIGLANGLGVAVLGVNAFVVTLATGAIFSGVAMLVSGGAQVGGLPREFTHTIGSGTLADSVPMPIVLAVPVVVILFCVLRWRRFGRAIFAIGGNAVAAQIAGIRVKSSLIATYVVAGTMTAYAGWLLTARVSSGQPHLGGELVMQSITAAIIGGASLRGGRGGVGGALLGVLFITVLSNGMNLLRLGSSVQGIILGVALVLAVLIDRARDRVRVRVAVG